MELCSQCETYAVAVDTELGVKLCFECGTLAEDGPVLVNNVIGTSFHRPLHDAPRTAVFKNLSLIEKVTSRLHLSSNENDRIRHLMLQVMRTKVPTGRHYELVIGACACIVQRQQGTGAMTMHDIASSLHCPVEDLGRVFRTIVSHLHLHLPLQDPARLLSRICRALIPSDSCKLVESRANELVLIAKEHSLLTGRPPQSIAAAAVLLAARAKKLKISFEAIGDIVLISSNTVRQRYIEISEAVLELVKRFPWAKDIQVRHVPKHLDNLLQNIQLLRRSQSVSLSSPRRCIMSRSPSPPPADSPDNRLPISSPSAAPSPSYSTAHSPVGKLPDLSLRSAPSLSAAVSLPAPPPPSFRRSVKLRTERHAKVQLAHDRLQQVLSGTVDEMAQQSAASSEELMMERCLLYGVPSELLEDGHFKAALAAIPQQSEVQTVSRSLPPS
eukprot:GILJ01006814.1.p1 GENE.GILJ01006814.1~~GILJ01006814.1.p1  ORF type:complete len:442 (+),score=28.66 GILJ01006814.1:78-1403(+)